LKIAGAAAVATLAGSARPAGGDVSASTTPATPIPILSGDAQKLDNLKNLNKEAEKTTIAAETYQQLEGIRKFIANRKGEFSGSLGIFLDIKDKETSLYSSGFQQTELSNPTDPLQLIDQSLAKLAPYVNNQGIAVPVQIDFDYSKSDEDNNLYWNYRYTTYSPGDEGKNSWATVDMTGIPKSGGDKINLTYLFDREKNIVPQGAFARGAIPQALLEPMQGVPQEPYILPTQEAVDFFNTHLLNGLPVFLQNQVPKDVTWETRTPDGPALYP